MTASHEVKRGSFGSKFFKTYCISESCLLGVDCTEDEAIVEGGVDRMSDGVDRRSDGVLQYVDNDITGATITGTRRLGIMAAMGCDACVVVFKAGAYASCSII